MGVNRISTQIKWKENEQWNLVVVFSIQTQQLTLTLYFAEWGKLLIGNEMNNTSSI